MKTVIQTILISMIALAACDGAQSSGVEESNVRERRPVAAAPRPDDNERHLVLIVHVQEGQMSLEEVRLGVGPAGAYANEEQALRLELLDREGSAFSAIAIEDPLRVRAYGNGMSMAVEDPVEVRSEADTFFAVPLDPRLAAVHLLGEGYFAEPIALTEQIRNLCAADASEACRLYLSHLP